MDDQNQIIIKKRGEDGSRLISVRLREDILHRLDEIASESNHSRNELINTLLEHSLNNVKIQ